MIVMLEEEIIEALVEKFLRNNTSVALGTSPHAKTFLKKIALKAAEKELKVRIIPTSLELATLCTSLKLPIASINDREVDLAIEFATMVDTQFNFIKRETTSLIRDKMIAQSASEMIVVGEEESYVKRLHGIIPFEVDSFGAERTLLQLDEFGEAEFRLKKNGERFVTESGNYIIDVRFDQIYSLDDLEYDTKKIPGVIETGLFLGCADRIVLHNDRIKVKSRIMKLEEEVE
ncbi:MAG: ribose 5-phosphate isomerase A [Candidatus Diapherotrites archaeon]|nr:ribose 5-phosphate isomerase A [Candidatus Diapherotrites archaeon]